MATKTTTIKCYDNSPSSSYVNMGDVLNLSGDLSVSMWIIPNDFSSERFLIGKGQVNVAGWNFEIFTGETPPLDGGRLQFVASTSGAYTYTRSSQALQCGVLQQVGFVLNSTTGVCKLYINGVEVSGYSHNDTHTAWASTNLDFTVAAYSPTKTYNYDGKYKNILIYDSDLSDAQMLAIYADGVEASGALARWACDEGSGTDCLDGIASYDGTISTSDITAFHSNMNETYDLTYTNATYLKRSQLHISAAFTFKLNRGTTLDEAIDITKYVANIGTVTEKLSKSATNTGGVLLPNLDIEIENTKGKWNKRGEFFEEGYINGSEITVTTNYLDPDGAAITPAFVYKGLIKYVSCEWDRSKFSFKVTLIPASSLLASEKIAPGILSHTTFKNVCYAILNRKPFTKYLTISLDNFEMGWDVSAIDSYADMTHKKVKNVLDKIMLLTGSVYYVNYDGEFIIEPVEPSSPSAVCTLRGHDIIVNSEGYDWDSHYTGIEWDDDENEVQRVEMDYPTREQFQYDFRRLDLSDKYVTDSTKRTTIMNNLLDLYKYLKRRVKLTCKWNPEVTVNDYISLDVPEEAVRGDEFMVWNEATHNWNDGLYWGFPQPGISFNSGDLWRVVNIKRDADGEKMQLEIVQLNSDDEV